MKNMRNGLKGLSFIEVLITVFIIGIIILGLVNVLLLYTDVFFFKTDERESISNLDMIMDRLARDIRQGRRVLAISTYTLTIELSTGVTHTYSLITGNDGKKYFGVDGQILAGPINEIVFSGRKDDLTYTTNAYDVRVVTFTITMADGRNMSSMIALRAEIPKVAGGVVITEIMYYPCIYDKRGTKVADVRDMEFMVIYNGSNSTINLRNWRVNGTTKIQDAVIPKNDFNLPPGKYAIIGGSNSDFENTYNLPGDFYYYKTQQRGLYKSNSELPNDEGDISLEDSNQNLIDRFHYYSSWGGTPVENKYYSLVRINLNASSDNPNNWRNSTCLNYGVSVNASYYYSYCLRPVVVINEIMYRPGGIVLSDTNYEFVEIYNTSGKILNLSGWRINGNIFSSANTWTLPPGGYAVIGGRDSALNSWYNFPANYVYIKTSLSGLGDSGVSLRNSSDQIVIMDSNGVVLDFVNYSSSWGGYGEDGILDFYRYSLERKRPLDLSQSSENWSQSTSFNISYRLLILFRYNYYCTPGTKNSVSP